MAFYNTVSGLTETYNLSFRDHLTNQSLNDVDFDLLIKKDNQTIYKASDQYNQGKPLYTPNGNYSVTYTYPGSGTYVFEIPIFKVGNDILSNKESVNFQYDVTTQFGFGGFK